MKTFDCVLIIVAAGIGLGVGFMLRSRPVATVAGTAAVSATQQTRWLNPNRPVHIQANDDSPVATRLERDLSMSTGVTRWLYWLEALEKASPADFPRLARLAQGNSTALRFVAARWVEVAPQHLFDTLVAAARNPGSLPSGELAGTLFTEWPKRDPEAAIAALSGAENHFGSRSGWRMQVVNAVLENDVERGLRLMSDWNIENYGPNMKAVAKWAEANPRHAAEVALRSPAGYGSRLTMETIGKEWAKTDPAGALEFAAGARGEMGGTLATATLKAWAERNLNEAGDWLVGADDRTRNRLSPAFVEVWAKQDAAGALAWCEANLTGSTLAQAAGGVLRGAAAKDVGAAAALVTSMYPSAARAEAALGVAQKWFPSGMSEKPVPPETIAWLASLDGISVRRVLDEFHWRWSESDPKSLAAFLASSGSEQIPASVYSNFARRMARNNPSEALAWANELSGQHAMSAGTEAFNTWLAHQPEPALKWLNSLPADDTRREPFFRSFVQVLPYNSQALAQLTTLTPTERATARDLIQSMSLPEDRRTRLLGMLRQ